MTVITDAHPFTKVCSRCKKTKNTGEFSPHKRSSDRLRYECKQCGAEARQRARLSDPAKAALEKVTSREYRRKRYHEDAQWRAKIRAKRKASRLALPLEERRRQSWQNHLITAYGIRQAEYDAMMLKQNGVCACCGKKPKKWCIDHEHTPEKRIRGLLCAACNSGIALLGDSAEGLKMAIAYLER